MNRNQYKFLDSTLRKMERINQALEKDEAGYTHNLLVEKLGQLSMQLRANFSSQVISDVKYMRENAEFLSDRYARNRWVYYAWNSLKGYHDDAEIKRIRAKFWDYQFWKKFEDIPY